MKSEKFVIEDFERDEIKKLYSIYYTYRALVLSGSVEDIYKLVESYKKYNKYFDELKNSCFMDTDNRKFTIYFDTAEMIAEEDYKESGMTTLKIVDLSDEEVEDIREKNSQYALLKDLFKEIDESTPKVVVSTIIAEMNKAKLAYDAWFSAKQKDHKIDTTPQNSWNVDFDKKELQLLG